MKKILVVLLGMLAMMSILQAAEINGSVVNNQNLGIADLVVELNGFHYEEEITMETVTAEDGSFSFQDLTQGYYLIQVFRENGMPQFADVEIQSDDQIINDLVIQMHNGNSPPVEGEGSIAGTVMSEEELVAGAVVMAFTENDEFPGMHFVAETDEAGAFLLENLPNGEYFLAAFEGMRDGHGGHGFPELEDLVSVTISEETPNVEGIILELLDIEGGNGGNGGNHPEGEGSIAGTVMSEEELVAGAVVMAFTENEEFPGMHFVAETDEAGAFLLENLPNGEYFLAAFEGMRDGHGGHGFPELEDLVSVTISEETPNVEGIILELLDIEGGNGGNGGNHPEGEGSIAGTVMSEEELVAGAVVMAFTENEEFPGMHFVAESDEAGAFLLENLPNGEYFLAAFEGMRDGQGGHGFPELEDLVSVTISEETPNVEGIILELLDIEGGNGGNGGNHPEGDGSIAGTVMSEEELVAGAVVMAFTENEEFPSMHFVVESDEAGAFLLENLPNGEYFLAAFEGMRDGQGGHGFPELEDLVSVTISEETPNVEGIILELLDIEGGNGGNGGHNNPPEGTSSIVLTVTPELEIEQIHRISYFLMENNEGYVFSGHFEEYTQTIENLPAGDYVLSVYAPRHEEWIYDNAESFEDADLITLEDDASIEISAELSAFNIDYYTVEGFILNEEGNPIENAFVGFHSDNHHSPDGAEVYEVITNEDGEYSIEIPQGRYIVSAFAEGYMMTFWPNNNDFMNIEYLHVQSDLEDINIELTNDPWQEFTISGNVTIEGDTPESDQHVLIVAVSSEEDDADIYTESTMCRNDGSYDLILDRPGQYYVVAITSGTIPEYYSDAYDWEDANLIELGTDPVEGLDFDLMLPQSQGVENVIGTIYDNNGDVVSNATVLMMDSENMPIAFATTNQDGQYNIAFLAAQDYTMKATKIHYQSVEDTVNPADEDVVDVTLNEMTVENDDVNSVVSMLSNYPNPFNPTTTISYTIPANGKANLVIYNVRGQKVKTLVNEQQNAGSYTVQWDGKDKSDNDVASGVYMMKLTTSKSTQMKKIMLMK
jgi:flagellar hook assembly protein FlgD